MVLEGKEEGGDLSKCLFAGSVHPGLGQLSVAFTMVPVHGVRGANTAWAIQDGQLRGRNQTSVPSPLVLLSAECGPECFFCLDRKIALQGADINM